MSPTPATTHLTIAALTFCVSGYQQKTHPPDPINTFCGTFPAALAYRLLMKALLTAAAVLLLPLAGAAQTTGNCDQPIEAPLHMRADLTIDARPAELNIAGTDREGIRISCTVSPGHQDQAKDVVLRYSGIPDAGKLLVEHGPTNNSGLTIRIEIPRKTNLRVHMPAGEIDVTQVSGDKDISLYAGQLTISGDNPPAYHLVDASVDVGEVDASAWGVDKGGFFRRFRHETPNGEYHLRAHITTGEIDLK
ncbi:MAG TPA: hypothetical protein VHX37_15325 [Acidobacteriaceae bacterium]|nr:hypothetical protein [Acidobacteriaceae bacterium]